VTDNAVIHTSGDADIVEDLLWDTIAEGGALNVLIVFFLLFFCLRALPNSIPSSQSSTFLLEESNHSNTKLQALTLTQSCNKPTEFCVAWTTL
jgi:hypothetical protein